MSLLLLEKKNDTMTTKEVITTIPFQGGVQPPAPSACDIIKKGDMPFVPSTCDDAAGGLLSTHPDDTNDATGGLLSTHPGDTVTPLVASAVAKDMPPPDSSVSSFTFAGSAYFC